MEDGHLGQRLRQERERRKIPLESVAEETKISIGLLKDLERDHLDRWPSGIFRRSFIRTYAATIGLDPDQIAEEFLASYPDQPHVLSTDVPKTGSALNTAAAIAQISKTERRVSPAHAHGMRLVMNDDPQPFIGGHLLNRIPRRLAAALWDVGSAILLALLVYLWLDRFWIPFAVILACYHAGSVLALGNTPGVYFFAPAHVTGRGDPGDGDPAADDLAELHLFNPRSV